MIKVVTTRVGADGVLTVPLDERDANKEVRVIVETLEGLTETARPPADEESWLRFIERTGGAITDPTFQRHPQGDLEERDLLP